MIFKLNELSCFDNIYISYVDFLKTLGSKLQIIMGEPATHTIHKTKQKAKEECLPVVLMHQWNK